MRRILIIFIFVSIVFNKNITSVGNSSIYLNNILQVILCLVFVFYILLIQNAKKIKINQIDISVFLFFISISSGLRADFSSFFNYFRILIFIIYYIVFNTVLNWNYDKVDDFINCLCIAISIKNFIFLINYDILNLNIFNRIDVKSMGGFNNYSYIIALIIIIKLFYYSNFNYKNSFITKISKYSVFLDIIMLLILFSRGGWIAFILIFLVSSISLLKNKGMSLKNVVGSLTLIIILLIILINLNNRYLILSKVIDRFAMLKYDNGTGRAIVWRFTINYMKDTWGISEWLFGEGFGSFRFEFFSNQFDQAHNFFMQIFFEAGAIGFLFFVAFLYNIVRVIFKITKSCGKYIFLINIMIIFILSNLFDSHIYVTQTSWIYSFLIALISSTYNKLCIQNSDYVIINKNK